MTFLKIDRVRRRLSASFAALIALPPWLMSPASPALAADALQQRVESILGRALIREGRAHVDTPSLADNGHSVPLVVKVESAMTAQDHVRRILLVSENNPRALIATFHLTPKSGRAEITTRIRLNKSQRVMAIAELSDGTFWSGQAEVIVTESACLDAD